MFGLSIPAMMGIGAGLGFLTNRRDPLSGALTGGLLGGGAGAIGNMLKAGEALKGAELVSNVAPTTAGAFEASMGLPSSQLIGAGAPLSSAFPTGANMGLVTGASGNLVSPDAFAFAGTPLETFKGGQGLLANATGNLLDTLPDYVTPQNLLGAANVLSNITPRQQTQITPSPTGGMRQGGAVQSVNFGMAQPIPRRRGIM